MLIPIGDENPSGRQPVITYGLIAANVLAFFVANGWPFSGFFGQLPQRVALDWGLVPRRVGESPWTLLTSIFLHGDLMHLAGNLLFLWIAGDNVEDKLGRAKYLAFYLLSGILASATYLAYAKQDGIPLVGASGAIAGVLGCYMVFFPRARIRMLYWFYFFVGTFFIEARWFLGFWIAQNVFMWLVIPGTYVTGVAYAAHAGGFAVGVATAALLKGRLRRAGRLTAADRLTGFAGTAGRAGPRVEPLRPGRPSVSPPRPPPVADDAPPAEGFVDPRVETRRGGDSFFGLEEAVAAIVREGRLDAALSRYQDLLRLPHAKPLPAWAQIEIASEYFRRGDYEESLKAYRRFLAHHPAAQDAPEAKFRLGMILSRHRREYFRAREYLLQASLEHPEEEIRTLARQELARIEPLL